MSHDTPAVVARTVRVFRALGCHGELHHQSGDERIPPLTDGSDDSDRSTRAHTRIYDADGEPVLVVISGDKEPDLINLATALSAGRVRTVSDPVATFWTRQDPRAMAPVAHPVNLHVAIDLTLSRYSRVWVPAGHPDYLIATTYAELLSITAGSAIEIVQGTRPLTEGRTAGRPDAWPHPPRTRRRDAIRARLIPDQTHHHARDSGSSGR